MALPPFNSWMLRRVVRGHRDCQGIHPIVSWRKMANVVREKNDHMNSHSEQNKEHLSKRETHRGFPMSR